MRRTTSGRVGVSVPPVGPEPCAVHSEVHTAPGALAAAPLRLPGHAPRPARPPANLTALFLRRYI